MSGRRRKSKNYTAPANSTPVTPYRLQHPLRAARTAEAFLVASFIANVWGYWAVEFDEDRAAEDLDVMMSIATRLLPRATVAEVLVDDVGDDDQARDDGLPTMLWAATDWVLGLNLPTEDRDLWDGPPITER